MKPFAGALGGSRGGGGGVLSRVQRRQVCLVSQGQRSLLRQRLHAAMPGSSLPLPGTNVSTQITKLKQRLVQVGMYEDAFKEPTQPMPLIDDIVFEELYDREASLMVLCQAFSKRLQVKKANPMARDRKQNPLVAISAGPSAGKTRFIDTCMTLGKVGSSVNLAEVCPDKELQKELERCIPIPVTYTSFCSPFGQESNLSLEHSLISRVLYSYFCLADVPFGDFFASLRKVAHEFVSTLDQVVKEISNEGQRSVFLAVDELMKATTITGDVMQLLTCIGSNRANFHALVTSLNPDIVANITAFSGRPVHWVPLSPLSYRHSIEALAKQGLQFRVNKGTTERPDLVTRSLESEECRAAQAVIADCNGHPRSLEVALDLLQTYSVVKDNESPEPLPPYSHLIGQLAEAVKCSDRPAIMECPSIDEMVRPAICSDTVDFDGSPHDRPGSPTYSAYIASGLYLNSKHQTKGIPLLSPLILRAILSIKPKWTLAKPINELLSMDNDGFTYERFHAHWECLWRKLYLMHGKNETSLLEFYGLADTRSAFQDVRFKVAPKVVAQLGSDLTDEATQADLEAAVCLTPKPDQPGFDLATLETATAVTSKGKAAAAAAGPDLKMKLLLCHECKDSLGDTPKNDLPKILDAKYEHWKEQMREEWTGINEHQANAHL